LHTEQESAFTRPTWARSAFVSWLFTLGLWFDRALFCVKGVAVEAEALALDNTALKLARLFHVRVRLAFWASHFGS
jgi:hypothetical protein